MGQEEWVQVAAAQAGNQEAWAELYERYRYFVKMYVLSKLDKSLRRMAEDLTTDVFIRALGKPRELSWTGRPFRAYLTTVAHNMVIDLAKSSWAQRVQLVENTSTMDRVVSDVALEEAALEMIGDRLLAAIHDLTDIQQKVVVMRFWAGMSSEQIGSALGTNRRAVNAALFRAYRKLEESPLAKEAYAIYRGEE